MRARPGGWRSAGGNCAEPLAGAAALPRGYRPSGQTDQNKTPVNKKKKKKTVFIFLSCVLFLVNAIYKIYYYLKNLN